MVHDEVLDESVAFLAVVDIHLAVAGDLADLAVVFVVSPAVGSGALGNLAGGVFGRAREERGQCFE